MLAAAARTDVEQEDKAMKELILLYWGTALLMYLSQIYVPAEAQLNEGRLDSFGRSRCRTDIFMLIVIGWMASFMFLRTSYNDTYHYRLVFQDAGTVSEFLAQWQFKDWTGNPLSSLYRNLVRQFTDNHHIYFFFPSILSMTAVVRLCKRYSVNPAFSLLIFFSLGTYLLYMAALKQCFAVFILVTALPYAIEKKYVRFYALLAVAILFHTHALMFAIVPLLTGKPWGKWTWFLLGLTLFSMVTFNSTLGALMRQAESIGIDISEGELFDGHSINPLRVAVYWVPVLMALIFRENLFRDSTRTENLFVNMTIVGAFILTIGLVQAANLFARMAGYFELAMIIALPWMIKKLFDNWSSQFVTICASVLYFGYFWYENAINRGFEYDYAAITLGQFVLKLIG